MKGAHFAFRAGRPWDDGGDIIVVRGNPLFGITDLANVEVVVKDGTVYKGGAAPAYQARDAEAQ